MAVTQVKGKQVAPLPLDAASAEVTGILPIANGGTGQNTASAAINALLPTQTGNNGKVLQTDGSSASWQTPAGAGSGLTQQQVMAIASMRI